MKLHISRSFVRKAVILGAGLVLGAVASHGATLVFSDDFSSNTPGVLPLGTNWTWTKWSHNVADNGTNRFTRVAVDDANLFGKGTANHYLRIADTADTNGASAYNVFNQNNAAIGTVGTLAFDFYSPGLSGSQGDGWQFTLGNNTSNSNTAFSFYLRNGQLFAGVGEATHKAANPLATYGNGSAHSIVIYFNNSDQSVSYLSGNTLESGKMDIWLNGILVGTNLDGSGTLSRGADLTKLVINQKHSTVPSADFVGELYLDNVRMYSGIEPAVIPEAGSVALSAAALALACAIIVKRRR